MLIVRVLEVNDPYLPATPGLVTETFKAPRIFPTTVIGNDAPCALPEPSECQPEPEFTFNVTGNTDTGVSNTHLPVTLAFNLAELGIEHLSVGIPNT